MKRILRLIGLICAIAGLAYASNEIQMQGYMTASKGARSISRQPGTIALDWVGNKYAGPIIYTALTNYQPMAAVSFTTNGIIWIRNVGTYSSVTFSFDNGVTDHLVVKTNEFYFMRLAPAYPLTNLNYKLTTISTNYTGNDFEILILED